MLPAGVCTLLLAVLPLLGLLGLSLLRWRLTSGGGPRFAALGNYAHMLHDRAFWSSLGTTLLFAVESTALQLVLGVGIALLLARDVRGMGAVRALFMAPMMIAPLFVGMIWRLMLSDDFGIVKYLLSLLGVVQAPLWLDDPRLALQTICLVSVWEWTGFVVLFALAGLSAIPREVLEAAALDGCGRLGRVRQIVLPLLAPTLLAVVMLRLVDGFRLFDLVYATTAGGPGDSTTTMAWFVYQQGLVFFDLGYAATLAVAMLALTALLAWPLLPRAAAS